MTGPTIAAHVILAVFVTPSGMSQFSDRQVIDFPTRAICESVLEFNRDLLVEGAARAFPGYRIDSIRCADAAVAQVAVDQGVIERTPLHAAPWS